VKGYVTRRLWLAPTAISLIAFSITAVFVIVDKKIITLYFLFVNTFFGKSYVFSKRLCQKQGRFPMDSANLLYNIREVVYNNMVSGEA